MAEQYESLTCGKSFASAAELWDHEKNCKGGEYFLAVDKKRTRMGAFYCFNEFPQRQGALRMPYNASRLRRNGSGCDA